MNLATLIPGPHFKAYRSFGIGSHPQKLLKEKNFRTATSRSHKYGSQAIMAMMRTTSICPSFALLASSDCDVANTLFSTKMHRVIKAVICNDYTREQVFTHSNKYDWLEM